jgi:uncharacterized membrane protein
MELMLKLTVLFFGLAMGSFYLFDGGMRHTETETLLVMPSSALFFLILASGFCLAALVVAFRARSLASDPRSTRQR